MAVITETFTRSNSDTLGSNWTEAVGDWDISSNQAVTNIQQDNFAVWSGTFSPNNANYSVAADVSVVGNVSSTGVIARWVDSSNYYYARINTFGQDLKLYKYVDGVRTQLGSTFTGGYTNNTVYNLKLVVAGSSLAVYVDGTKRISAVDTSLTATGVPGLWSDYDSSVVDNFTVENVGYGIDITAGFGGLVGTGRRIVRDSNGYLYALMLDDANDDLEMWKSTDGGVTWSEQDATHAPGASASGADAAMAVDSNDVIHVIYETDTLGDLGIRYQTFSSGVWAATYDEVVWGLGSKIVLAMDIAIDSNNIPHVTYIDDGDDIYYDNKVGGIWNSTDVVVDNSGTSVAPVISIDADDIPFIAFYRGTATSATVAAIGNTNDATSFTLQNVDTTYNSPGNKYSITVDSSGNHHIVWGGNYIIYEKHVYGAAWTSWTRTIILNAGTGAATPSIVAEGTDLYIFYEDTNNDVAYYYNTGSGWVSGGVLQTGTYQNVRAKWALSTQYDSTGASVSSLHTYYFDGSDAAASDPDNVWTNETNADDGDISTSATSVTTGSVTSNELIVEGTNAPSTGGTIVSVKARAYGFSYFTNDKTIAAIYTDGGPESGGESLGSVFTKITTEGWGDFVALSAPTGGWSWSVLQALQFHAYRENNLEPNLLSRVEILVQTSDKPKELDYLYSDGTDVYYDNLSLGETLSTDYVSIKQFASVNNSVKASIESRKVYSPGGSWTLPIYGGTTSTYNELAWNFYVNSRITLDRIYVNINSIGTPADNLVVKITDELGGTALASTTLTSSDFSFGLLNNGVVAFSPSIELDPGNNYFIEFSRTGSRDEDNYRAITLDFFSSGTNVYKDSYTRWKDDDVWSGKNKLDPTISVFAAVDNLSEFGWQNHVTAFIVPSNVTENGPYYFNASDAGPTDTGSGWTDDANAFDGNDATKASTTAASKALSGVGTNSPTEGDPISSVWVTYKGDLNNEAAYVNILHSAEELGTISLYDNYDEQSYTNIWSGLYQLTAPSGGWTWQKVNDLQASFEANSSGGYSVYIAQVYVFTTTGIPSVTKDNDTLAKIILETPKANVSLANIEVVGTQQNYVRANILNDHAVENSTLGCIVSTKTQNNQVVANIQATLSVDNATRGTIEQSVSYDNQVVANIEKSEAVDNASRANIEILAVTYDQNNQIIASIQVTFSNTNEALASIFYQNQQAENSVVANIETTNPVENTVKAWIVSYQEKSSDALANIEQTYEKNNSVVATVQGVSQYQNQVKADILVEGITVSQDTKASIYQTISTDNNSLANIIHTTTQENQSLANIKVTSSYNNVVRGTLEKSYSFNNVAVASIQQTNSFANAVVACLVKSESVDNQTLANIENSYPQDNIVVGNILNWYAKANYALANISQEGIQQNSVRANLEKSSSWSTDSLASIQQTETKDNNVKAWIEVTQSLENSVRSTIERTNTEDNQALAYIYLIQYKDNDTVANLVKAETKANSVLAQIESEGKQPNSVRANILVVDNTIENTSIANISQTRTFTNSTLGNIEKTETGDNNALANIQTVTSKDNLVRANLESGYQQQNYVRVNITQFYSYGNNTLASIQRTITYENITLASIFRTYEVTNQTLATIEQTYQLTNEALANINRAYLKDNATLANISKSGTEQNLVKANIERSVSFASDSRASIVRTESYTNISSAWIEASRSIGSQVVANIENYYSSSHQSLANIENFVAINQSVVACIEKLESRDNQALGNIESTKSYTNNSLGYIYWIQTKDVDVLANIQNFYLKANSVIGTVEQSGQIQNRVRANILVVDNQVINQAKATIETTSSVNNVARGYVYITQTIDNSVLGNIEKTEAFGSISKANIEQQWSYQQASKAAIFIADITTTNYVRAVIEVVETYNNSALGYIYLIQSSSSAVVVNVENTYSKTNSSLGVVQQSGQAPNSVRADILVAGNLVANYSRACIEITQEQDNNALGTIEQTEVWDSTTLGWIVKTESVVNTVTANIEKEFTYENQSLGYVYYIQTKDSDILANILRSESKDNYTRALIEQEGLQQQSVRANILVVDNTVNNSTKANISITPSFNNSTLSNIETTESFDSVSKAWLEVWESVSSEARANIDRSYLKDNLSRASIEKSNEQINYSRANILVIDNVITNSTKAHIVILHDEENLVKAHLQVSKESNNQARANLERSVSQSQAVRANIQTPYSADQDVVANISQDVYVENDSVANIIGWISKDNYVRASIESEGVYLNYVVANIEKPVTQTNNSRANIVTTESVDNNAVANISLTRTVLNYVTANISAPITQEVSVKAWLSSSVSVDSSTKANIHNTYSQNNQVMGNIWIETGYQNYVIASLIQSVTKDSDTKANLIKETPKANLVIAYVYVVNQHTQNARANILAPSQIENSSKVNISAPSSHNQSSKANISTSRSYGNQAIVSLEGTSQVNNLAVANISKSETNQNSVVANISSSQSQANSAQAYLFIIQTQDNYTAARIHASSSKDNYAVGNISVANNTQTNTTKAYILRARSEIYLPRALVESAKHGVYGHGNKVYTGRRSTYRNII